jgi:hypothetical protein
MRTVKAVVGIVTGSLLTLSAAAHSLVGWPALATELAATTAQADLVQGIQVGWHFGGVAMLAFGVMSVSTFVGRLKGRAVPTLPVALVSAAYIGFGAWALWVSNFDPFFFVFVIPGVLLAVALS